MLAIDTLLIFFAASVVLALTPGPDNIFVLTQAARQGRLSGVWVTFGLCTGLLFHTTAVALGIAAIFQTSALAFTVLKIIGAMYLLYLAWQAFRSKKSDQLEESNTNSSRKKLYLRGVILNITNPKVAIFFLAFLPQFVNPEYDSIATQILLLGGVFMIATLLVFCSIAWAAGFIGDWLKNSEKAEIMLNRIAGTVFVGLALRLALSER
jgi:threonine/homoserine/homoserine lactone efflux protein